MIKDFKNKISKIEDRVSELLTEMKIKFDVDTFLHFDKLNIKHIDISNFEIKILASENFEDESKLVEKTNRQGVQVLGYKKKNTRHNIFFLSSSKVNSLELEVLEKTFKSAYELYSLFYRYKALREEINTTFELRFLNHQSCLFLSLVNKEYFLEKQQNYSDFNEYLEFQSYIRELNQKDRDIEIERNNLLSSK
ncbi:hypothetical protein NG767_04375 [Aliarcobacter cryaerophilus]|uniref:hypothetical protein n=1 Tax=Aliarcobacter cryaerophilus TaxID=28198 RepID=UPI003DA45461